MPLPIPLFETYPALARQFPHIALAELPTPVETAGKLAATLGLDALYIKRDDLSGRLYGGNKVRKLEFLLGCAMQRQAKTVVTYGAAGSNHALATAIYAKEFGLRSISILTPQPNSLSVRRNLLRAADAGTEMVPVSCRRGTARATRAVFEKAWSAGGPSPFVIPPGGSSPIGALGYVNAAFELCAQIETGLLPAPDVIYVASGTMGTCIGLLAGIELCGLAARIEAIAVTVKPYTDIRKGHLLYAELMRLLRSASSDFAGYTFPHGQLRLREAFLGKGYGWHSPQSRDAVARAETLAGLHLEGTYTGKALAALVADAAAGLLESKNVLFWNTYNSRDISVGSEAALQRTLPYELQEYYHEPVQESATWAG